MHCTLVVVVFMNGEQWSGIRAQAACQPGQADEQRSIERARGHKCYSQLQPPAGAARPNKPCMCLLVAAPSIRQKAFTLRLAVSSYRLSQIDWPATRAESRRSQRPNQPHLLVYKETRLQPQSSSQRASLVGLASYSVS